MGMYGSAMIYMQDHSINTLENLFKMKQTDFDSFALNNAGKVVPVHISGLRIDEQVNEVHHIIVNNTYDILANRYQQFMMADGTYKTITNLVPTNRLLTEYYYVKGNFDEEFIKTDLEINHLIVRVESGALTYTFNTEGQNNVLIPVIIEAKDPTKSFRAIYNNQTINLVDEKGYPKEPDMTAIRFVCVHDEDWE